MKVYKKTCSKIICFHCFLFCLLKTINGHIKLPFPEKNTWKHKLLLSNCTYLHYLSFILRAMIQMHPF